MKKQTTVAILIATATIVLIACKWFQSNNKSASSIVGKWKVDSMYQTGKDTNSIAFFFFALAKRDKDSLSLQFNADSTCKDFSAKDSTLKKYYVEGKDLFLKEDTSFQKYQLLFLSDSTATLTSKDSVVLVLKKQ